MCTFYTQGILYVCRQDCCHMHVVLWTTFVLLLRNKFYKSIWYNTNIKCSRKSKKKKWNEPDTHLHLHIPLLNKVSSQSRLLQITSLKIENTHTIDIYYIMSNIKLSADCKMFTTIKALLHIYIPIFGWFKIFIILTSLKSWWGKQQWNITVKYSWCWAITNSFYLEQLGIWQELDPWAHWVKWHFHNNMANVGGVTQYHYFRVAPAIVHCALVLKHSVLQCNSNWIQLVCWKNFPHYCIKMCRLKMLTAFWDGG